MTVIFYIAVNFPVFNQIRNCVHFTMKSTNATYFEAVYLTKIVKRFEVCLTLF